MKKMKSGTRAGVAATAVMVLALIGAESARAQTPPQSDQQTAPPTQPPARGRGQGGGAGQAPGPQILPSMAPNEIERLFDSVELFNAQGALQLTNQEFLTFGQRLQQFQLVRRQHQINRRKILADLIALTQQATPDEATLTARTKALDDLELQAAQDEQKAFQSLDQVLNVYQRARLRVFLDNQERRKQQLIALAQQQAKKPPTPPAPTPKPIT
jgi:hypothetical protein